MNYNRRIKKSEVPKEFRRKVLIDGGYHIGQYTEAFLRKNPGFEIFAFDPIKFQQAPTDVRFYDKAIWIKDGSRTLYLSKRADAASLVDTRAVNLEQIITVDCIDFSQWLAREFTKEDFIHLKLDIEGAEYEVLQKMINDKTIELISELVCEWHMRISRKPDWKLEESLKHQLTTFSNLRKIQDWR